MSRYVLSTEAIYLLYGGVANLLVRSKIKDVHGCP